MTSRVPDTGIDAERGRADLLQRTELRVLGLVAAGEPLSKLLATIVLGFEAQCPDMVGSVLLLDPKEKLLWLGAAPHLPAEYNAIADGHCIGPFEGSCGTAAYLRERVIVSDIATDPRWAKYKEIAARFGLAACWSEPILDQTGEVAGTFAMYYRTPRAPTAWETGLIEIGAKLASIAIARSRAEAALRASEERLRGALAAARMGTWEWNVATGEVIWSRGVEAVFGLPEGSFGATYEAYVRAIADCDRARIVEALDDALAGRAPNYAAEHRVRLPDGTTRWLEGKGTVYRDASGAPLRLSGTVADITARKETEAALRASEAQVGQSRKMQAVGRLAGGIAHDFNNLLTVINASSRMALRRVTPGSDLDTLLAEIAQAGDRAADLTRQLLAFSRQKSLTLETIDLTRAVEGGSALLKRALGPGVELVMALEPDVGAVGAEAGQIERIVMNLAVNARDAMPGAGRLTIGTRRALPNDLPAGLPEAPGGYLELSVSDTGHGMDAEAQSHLFEPFFTTKKPGEGTGLGLSIVYGLVEQLRGRIVCRSQLGRGTTFRVVLPRVEPAATEPTFRTRPEPQDGDGAAATVLLVEDDASVRSLARRALEEHGYRVIAAADGREGLQRARDHAGPISLLVTDVVMPEVGGPALVESVCPLHPEMKILFISGHADDPLVRRAMNDHGALFLQKPFDMETLLERVTDLTGVGGGDPKQI